VALNWGRSLHNNANFLVGQAQLGGLPNGVGYRRVRFSWGFVGHTSTIVNLPAIEGYPLVMGLVTTIGNGTETAPNAIGAPNDAAPPTQRWIWWEARAAVCTAVDENAGIMTWSDSGAQDPVDSKVAVLAVGVPGGQTLNLWASWAAPIAWDPSGTVNIWISASVLYG
jgi:hypothetical protein